jgi:uncharacterized DUF497 family protein
MVFGWDNAKNKANIRKHRIDFEDVAQVFDSPMIIRVDDREAYGEERLIGTGFLGNVVVVIVFTEINEKVVRIISARKANKDEQKRFEQEIADRLG